MYNTSNSDIKVLIMSQCALVITSTINATNIHVIIEDVVNKNYY